MLTTRRVRCSPNTRSDRSSAKKRMMRPATDEGNGTDPMFKRLSTPKQLRRIRVMPVGTYSHECAMCFHDAWAT